MTVDHVVALTPFTGECLHHGCCGQGKNCTDRTEEGRSSERCTEGHGRVQLHRAGRDAWRKEVVLDLLVNNNEPDDDRCLDRRVEEREQHGQDASEVRTDYRQELADEANPQGQSNRRLRANRLEHDPVEERRQQCEKRSGVEVSAGLVDRQFPRIEDTFLTSRGEAGTNDPAKAGAVGNQVVGEQERRQTLKDDPERRQ